MSERTWRSELLLAYCGPSVRSELAALAQLEAMLSDQLERGAEHWPGIELAPEQYLQTLADILHAPRMADRVKHLTSFVATDVYLASACLAGNAAAVTALRDSTMPGLRRALNKLGAARATRDEIEQRVFDAVLVGDRPQLASYSGRGSLPSWVRTIGVRMCRRQLGQERAHAGDDRALDDLALEQPDLELAYLKRHYRDQFRDAFTATASELTERQRNILRQQHIDGLSIDALANLYKVHRATAARWAAAARRSLLDGTRERLTRSLGIDGDDVDSIIRLVRSQLDISIHALLE